MLLDTTFKPAWWLSNPHAQTLYPVMMRRLPTPRLRKERLELADGDFIDLAWSDEGLSSQSPLVILLHGLCGSADSSHILGQLQAYRHQGFRAVVMHFRGASHEPNRLPRFYHSGETEDFNVVIHTLAGREPTTPKAVVGFSLGGNVLLKWLGERGAQSLVKVAVAVSVPFQLSVAANRINSGFSRVYQAHFLKGMRKAFLKKFAVHPQGLAHYVKVSKTSRSFWTFDDQVTAPLHGFEHVNDYYQKASSKGYLKFIQTPTLIIHSRDDPFMTEEAVPTASELSDAVALELTSGGGHVGFVSGRIPGVPTYWLDSRIPLFLREHLLANKIST